LPSTDLINNKRIARFTQQISDTLATEDLGFYLGLLEQYQTQHDIPALEIAAALARILQGDKPFLLKQHGEKAKPRKESEKSRDSIGAPKKHKTAAGKGAADMEKFRIGVGKKHGVKPGNIVGAIANEAGLDSRYIGQIDIYDDYSTVDLPLGMPKDVFNDLKKVWVSGQQLNISRIGSYEQPARDKNKHKNKKEHQK
jgi:ATP-dependent RNA helicase DeaD